MHLIGFIIKKFVMMHGHTNVKNRPYYLEFIHFTPQCAFKGLQRILMNWIRIFGVSHFIWGSREQGVGVWREGKRVFLLHCCPVLIPASDIFSISLYVVLLHNTVDTLYFLKLLVTFLPWHTLCRSNAIEEFLFFLLQVPKLDYLKHFRDPQTRWSTCVCSCGKQCCGTFSSIQLPAGQLGCHKQLVS